MKNTWVLVADSASALLYEQRGKADVKLHKTFSHPESQKKGTELASDRPGHNQSKGDGHGAYVDSTSPKEYEADRFAHELANTLEQGRTKNKYSDLVLVAGPQFYGLLNKHLNKHVTAMISQHIDKGLTNIPEHERVSRLTNSLKPSLEQ